jgi:murein DD-endopeptidase MepM/ murein hydrolase activator NlpD
MVFRINPQLFKESDDRLRRLLEVIVQGINRPERSEIDEQAKINPQDLISENQESIDQSKFFVIDHTEGAAQRQKDGQLTKNGFKTLTLSNVQQILISIIQLLYEEKHYRQRLDLLDEEHVKNLHLIEQQLKDRVLILVDLHTRAEELKDIVKIITEVKPEEKKTAAPLETTLSPFLLETLSKTAFECWVSIRQGILLFEKNQVGDIGVSLEPNKRITAPLVRDFFNQWILKLYEENKNRKKREQVPLPDLNSAPLFPTTDTLFRTGAFVNLDIVTKQDFMAIEFFKKVFEQLLAFKLPEEAGRFSGAPEAEDGEGNPLTEEKNPKELEELIDRMANAGVTYRYEVLRVRTLVLDQFFRVHGIDPITLGVDFPLEYRNIENELSRELERALRDYSPEDLAKLNTAGGRLGLLRTLYSRLATNPRFVSFSQQIVEKYETKTFGAGDNPAKTAAQERRQATTQNLDQALTEELEKNLSKWDLQSLETAADARLSQFSKTDLQRILSHFQISDQEQQDLFSNTDVLLYLRFSPERLATLDKEQFYRIFGVSPEGLDDAQFQKLCSVMGEYFYSRRERFTQLYGKESISQAQDSHLDSYSKFRDEDLNQIDEAKKFISDSKLSARVFAAGAALDSEEISQLEHEEHQDAVQIYLAYQLLLEKRAKALSDHLNALAIDEEKANELARATGLKKSRKEGEYTQQASKLYLQKQGYSAYDDESGWVEDRQGQGVRQGLSPLDSSLAFARGLGKRVFDEGLAALGTSILSSTGVGILLPKFVKKGIGAAAILAIGAALAALVAFIGLLGSWLFSLLANLSQSMLGTSSASALQQAAKTSPGSAAKAGGGGGAGFGPQVAANSPLAGIIKATTRGIAGAFSNPGSAGVIGMITITSIGAIVMRTITLGAFLPPTLGSDLTESKYISIEKVASPPSPLTDPQKITYDIKISAKPGYKVTISDLKDTFDIKTNTKTNPTTPPIPTSPVNFQTLSNGSGSIVLDGTGGGADSIQIPSYSIDFDNKYKDSLVSNTVEVKLSTTDEGKAVNDTALGQASICFGDCPQPKAACWPTSGKIVQVPYQQDNCAAIGSFQGQSIGCTHAKLDAFDISTGLGSPVYAPFAGRACATFDTVGYGIHVMMDVNSELGSFQLIFGHFASIDSTITGGPNQCADVQPGDIIGRVDSTGLSAGNHLHYEVRTKAARQGQSFLRSLVPDGESVQNGNVVSSCYGTSDANRKGPQ